VTYDAMDSSETLEAKMMSGNSGYDLIFPGDTIAERLMRAGSLQTLDKSKLTALADIEPGLQKMHDAYPNAKDATVPYTWGSIGLTFNEEMINTRMANAPVNSLDMLFKPELAAKFADCGIAMLDSPDEVLSVVLNYLGRPPRSGEPADLQAAEDTLMKLRPHIRKFQSTPHTELVNVELCLALGYSGSMIQAQWAADEAHKPVTFGYRIPKEGSTLWMDTMAIPADAKNTENAYAFINFVMRPENMAAITNYTGYPTANAKAKSLVAPAMTSNPDIYIDDAVYARLITGADIPQKTMRARMRTWTKFKTGTQ